MDRRLGRLRKKVNLTGTGVEGVGGTELVFVGRAIGEERHVAIRIDPEFARMDARVAIGIGVLLERKACVGLAEDFGFVQTAVGHAGT